MLWKRETTRIWGEKFDRKTFTIICEVICRFSRESRRGQISRLVKQTNSIQARSPFRFDTRVCQWFYNSRSNDQKRLQWAVFYGTSAAWCLYRPDTSHSFLTFTVKTGQAFLSRNNFIIANLISGIISLIWLLDEWCKIQIKPEFKTRILIGLWRENLTGVSICVICQGRLPFLLNSFLCPIFGIRKYKSC